MADVDVSGVEDAVAASEVLARHLSLELSAISDAVAADVATGSPKFLVHFHISVAETLGALGEVVTMDHGVRLVRGEYTAMIEEPASDWALLDKYPKYRNGFPLKGIIFMPGSGGPDTFVIRDGENGPYLYNAAVAANTLVVYSGALCKPFIDYSECSLSSGNIINFIW
jgi:hypothetical protein